MFENKAVQYLLVEQVRDFEWEKIFYYAALVQVNYNQHDLLQKQYQ